MKTGLILLIFLIHTFVLNAQSGIDGPSVGLVRDPSGAVRPVLGLAANFWLGKPVAVGVLSCGFSGRAGLLKTSSRLLVLDARGQTTATLDAPEGPALFAFSRDGAPSLVYYPLAGQIQRWVVGRLEPIPLDTHAIPGVVLALSYNGGPWATLLVQRDRTIWKLTISTFTGFVRTRTAVPGIAAPVLLNGDGSLVYSTAHGVILRRADGSETPLAGPVSAAGLTRLGEDWILAREPGNGRSFALRLTPGRERAYQLPEVAR